MRRITLYYLHKAEWTHHDVGVANKLWIRQDDQWIGKLTDLEYAKKKSWV